MSKQQKTQSNQTSNTTKSKQLFTPLNQQEQQTISGGWVGWASGATSAIPSHGF